ncbi:MAG: sugar ABC transporter ATP-binding protein [Desulfobacteraceae bacterium]|nr:MAG: sugar ABC transporter ATP-binding protein [Desulfobacteraceae bacterium]
MTDYRLEMKGISKAFFGVKALDGVDFELKPGEIHALLGINGAGKSTLIKILSGTYHKDAGAIILDGQTIEINSPQDAMNQGIATVYQDPEMISSFTGYENIFLGFETEKKGSFARIDRKKLHAKAQRILKQFPAKVDLTRPVLELNAVEQEIIAILRALSRKMVVLVLDEPTSILTENEKQVLFRLMDLLKERGIAIIYISHRLEEIFQVADRLTVIRDGQNVATMEAKELGADHMAIAELMLGEKMDHLYPVKTPSVGEEMLAVSGLSFEDRFQDISFSARIGQILGIFGLVGSGVEELAKVIFGLVPSTRGKLQIRGRDIQLRSPRDAIKNGIFLIPSDRRREGLIDVQPLAFNVSLASLRRVVNFFGFIRRKKEKKEVFELIEQLAITPADVNLKVSYLSGGNQQKVVISKGLFTEAQIYIFLEPTAGVDVGAKAGIYNLIRKLSDGAAVILISSDCEEISGMCDHVMAMFKGRVTLDEAVGRVTPEEILLCGVKGSTT